MNLKKNLFNNAFSHIYVENKALNHPNTNNILSTFNKSTIIEINHYKDIFSRSHQNFYLQKQSPSLILAVKENNLLYKGAKFCDDFDNDYFYYTSSMMNCIYNCEYCYLQGMYTSANMVVFVNIEDIFDEVDKLLAKHPVYLSISYDSDLLAFENILGYCSKWIEFAKLRKNLKIELRTKSANFTSIKHLPSTDNVILAWTLSPEIIAKQYEDKTPSLLSRLESVKDAMKMGWKIRLCFDPILYINNWQESYKSLIDTTFSLLSTDGIHDISIGVFRVSSDYLKIMRSNRLDSSILNYPFTTKNKVSTYNQKLSNEMISYVYNHVSNYIHKDKIYI